MSYGPHCAIWVLYISYDDRTLVYSHHCASLLFILTLSSLSPFFFFHHAKRKVLSRLRSTFLSIFCYSSKVLLVNVNLVECLWTIQKPLTQFIFVHFLHKINKRISKILVSKISIPPDLVDESQKPNIYGLPTTREKWLKNLDDHSIPLARLTLSSFDSG
jgi:hypothetical protein